MSLPIDTQPRGLFPVARADVKYVYKHATHLCMEAWSGEEWIVLDSEVLSWFDFADAMAYFDHGIDGKTLRVVPASTVRHMDEDDRLTPIMYFGRMAA